MNVAVAANLWSTHLHLPYALDITAITIGALSGALHATRKNLGMIGILAVALCTGLGGGAIRDVVLDTGMPAFLKNPAILGYAVLGAVIAYFFAKFASKLQLTYDLLDAFLIGVWVLIASGKAIQLGLGAIASVYVGLIAATGGGLLRDLLCKDPPAVLKPGQWYALSACFAAITFVYLQAQDIPLVLAQIATMVVATTLRLTAIFFRLPTISPFDVSDRIQRIFQPVRR